jgi:hypothetical protein
MKKNNDSRYSDISSFEDFRAEKERLIFRSKLNESKLNLDWLRVHDIFSVTGLILSVAKDTILPVISGFIGDLMKKSDKEADS